jgi:hypothetical protein
MALGLSPADAEISYFLAEWLSGQRATARRHLMKRLVLVALTGDV